MLHYHASNRVENLVSSLAQCVQVPPDSVLEPEIIIVQSRGMQRWLCMRLAERLGVWANAEYPFPTVFLQNCFERNGIGNTEPTGTFDREVMRWSLMDILSSRISRPGYESLRRYLDDEVGRDLRLFQLVSRVSQLFDQYIVYRPEMLVKWEEGFDQQWQADLWRQVIARHGKWHRAALREEFFHRFSQGKAPKLPSRFSIFGISSMPPFLLEIFAHLSRFSDVHFYMLNPCRQYWGDIESRRSIVKKERAERRRRQLEQLGPNGQMELDLFAPPPTEAPELFLETGNPLLSSLGKLGRDLLDKMMDLEPIEHDCYEVPQKDTLLARVQRDLLDLQNPTEKMPGEKTRPVLSGDRSITLHSCHSPMREIEVLHDQLLDLFEKDPSLEAQDVIVMAPRIEDYAPGIQAVFDRGDASLQPIPFSVADRSARSLSVVGDAVLSVFKLVKGRFGVAEVTQLLENEVIRRRFKMSEGDLDTVKGWLIETKIRWGVDGASKEALGLPAEHHNTWRFGLERMLLGYALPGDDHKLFEGVLPYDHIEGSDASLLGSLADFFEVLDRLVNELQRDRTLKDWAGFLRYMTTLLLETDADTATELELMLKAYASLEEQAELSEFDKVVSFEVIADDLESLLEEETSPAGFLGGGVTFCSLLPMRSIPFKIVYLLGMNGDSYPRPDQGVAFDLVRQKPKNGDRSRRDDDRYLFLEAILAARERMIISFVGQNIRNNEIRPPSVFVSELLDYLEDSYGKEDEYGKLVKSLTVSHPLQPFSPRYFRKNQSRLFSFSSDYCSAGKTLGRERLDEKKLFHKELPPATEEYYEISLDKFCDFFANPTRALVRDRLGIRLDGIPLLPEEREPFGNDGLEKWHAEQYFHHLFDAGVRGDDAIRLVRACGILAHGTAGDLDADAYQEAVAAFQEDLKPYGDQIEKEPLVIDETIDGVRITGQLTGIYAQHLIRARFTKVRAADRLRVWIHHLFLNLLSLQGYPKVSRYVGSDEKFTYREIGDVEARSRLKDLVSAYRRGLVIPLQFFPETSYKYVEKQRKGEKRDAMKKAAEQVWLGSDRFLGERERDPYVGLVYKHQKYICGQESFQKSAKDLLIPLVNCLRV